MRNTCSFFWKFIQMTIEFQYAVYKRAKFHIPRFLDDPAHVTFVNTNSILAGKYLARSFTTNSKFGTVCVPVLRAELLNLDNVVTFI